MSISKYPVDLGDQSGIVDAVNYLLSGPSGLGQNFAGFSSFTQAYLTGNYRVPYTVPGFALLYVAPIPLGTCDMQDGRTWRYYFATPQSTPPFAVGNNITIEGVADSFYDGTYNPIGVVECTNEYVIARTNGTYDIVPPSSGGTVSLATPIGSPMSTDANARVVVTGGQDRVFISGQLNQNIYHTGSGNLGVTVEINRYFGYLDDQPINPDYKFQFDTTVARKEYNFTGLDGFGILPEIHTVFATVLDKPKPGYYWYILEIVFNPTNTVQVTADRFAFRSLSAQVVKQ